MNETSRTKHRSGVLFKFPHFFYLSNTQFIRKVVMFYCVFHLFNFLSLYIVICWFLFHITIPLICCVSEVVKIENFHRCCQWWSFETYVFLYDYVLLNFLLIIVISVATIYSFIHYWQAKRKYVLWVPNSKCVR